MSGRLLFLRSAAADVAGLIQFLSESSPGAAGRFEAALEAAIRRIEEYPRIGRPVESRNRRLHGIRSWPVRGFPDILAFYRLEGGRLHVVRVLHGARDLAHAFGEDGRREEE